MKLSKSTCITDKGCEYYVDRMAAPATGLKPQAKFSCKRKAGVTSDEATCAAKTTQIERTGVNCEWQCPFTVDSRNQSGYIVKKSIDEILNLAINEDLTKSDLTSHLTLKNKKIKANIIFKEDGNNLF